MRPWRGAHRESMTPTSINTLAIENAHGEQALFVYDRDARAAVVYLGDAGWETAHAVVDGSVPDLVLNESERLWLRACWQACRGE